MRIGDSDLLVMGASPCVVRNFLAALHVYVKDCDATYQRALDAGAVTIGGPGVGEPADRPYGERAAFVQDPFGNYWFIATRHGSNYVGVGLGHVTPSLLPSKAAPVLDFLKRAFGAEVEGVHGVAGRMLHAFIRIGKVMLGIAEAKKSRVHSGFICTRKTSTRCITARWPRGPLQSCRLQAATSLVPAIGWPSSRIPPAIAGLQRNASSSSIAGLAN